MLSGALTPQQVQATRDHALGHLAQGQAGRCEFRLDTEHPTMLIEHVEVGGES